MAISQQEENYLKSILHLQMALKSGTKVSTNAIARELGIQAASVTEMLKKLSLSGHLEYERYQGVALSKKGWNAAAQIIRKHRLWETFLVQQLNFDWSEVHVIAEQLEHIQSDALIDKLDEFLGFPQFDPHGDPIPDNKGHFPEQLKLNILQMPLYNEMEVCGVAEDSVPFLAYLQELKIQIGTRLSVVSKQEYDNSCEVRIGKKTFRITGRLAENILVRKI